MARACERCQYENTDEARFCLQCGAMLEMTQEKNADPMIGRVLLQRYRVVSELGEGGMGKVYLAEQKMGTAIRKVAIKTLHPELSGDPQLVARFHRECETVIELHHPNTVKFYDFGDLEDKTLFIVMEYIEGGDLAHRLRDVGSISPALADKLIIQICGSLHEAHERGVVHRDLKPENVLLTTRGGQDNFVKVLDFGIAKRSEAEDASTAKLTKQGMVLGTPPYMSPEQFSGQTLDLRSDIYSLGVMTYEMVTGHLPFEAKTPWEWATKHLTVQPAPIDSHPAGAALPEQKRNAIMRALSKNRDERQPNVLAFMHEFTGLGDAQVAWTMATSSGVSDSNSAYGGGTPSGVTPVPPGVAGANPSVQVPSHHTYHPTPTPGPTDFASGPLPTQSRGGSGKWVALSLGAFVLLGAAAGGAWIMTRPTEVVANVPPVSPTPPNTNPPNVNPPNTNPANNIGTPIAAPMVEVPMVEVPMVEIPMVEVPMVEVPMVEVAEMNTSMMTTAMDSTSAADRARGAGMLSAAEAHIGRNDVAAAAQALAQAQRLLGRRDGGVRRVRTSLQNKANIVVGNAVMQGRCPQARSMLTALHAVGLDSAIRRQLGDACQ